jgi:hypothetical protein
MANTHKARLTKLKQKLKGFNKTLGKLGNGSDVEELLKIIHRPGWTTIAELTFVHGIVDSMHAHVEAIHALKSALLSGSKQVGRQ